MALAIGDRLFLAGKAQMHLLAHVAGRGPAHQRLHRARRLGLEIKHPALGFGVARLHGGLGWLVNAGCHGMRTGWGLCRSVEGQDQVLATARRAEARRAKAGRGGHPGQVNDGLPESLEEVVAAYGHRYFKLKVSGNLAADQQRLIEIASVLDRIAEPCYVSLDGNEQYDDIDALLELWRRMEAAPQLKRLVASILFIEQPITRARALDSDVSSLSQVKPVIIDESDDGLGVFARARDLCYLGVSSKCCKGL